MSISLLCLTSLAAAGYPRRADFVAWDLAAHGEKHAIEDVAAALESLAKKGLVHAEGKDALRVFRVDGDAVREALKRGFEKMLKTKKTKKAAA